MIGRASHAEGLTPVGVRVGGLAVPGRRTVGTLAAALAPSETLTSGSVWAGTLVGGMLLRALTGGGVEVSS